MDDLDKLFTEFCRKDYIMYINPGLYDVNPNYIDMTPNLYSKEKIVAVILKWMLDGRP